MKPDILTLVCDPATNDVLEVGTGSDARGCPREFLVNPQMQQA